jgi:hypothetical protein
VIIYDLRCKNGHKFEGWFKDMLTFESQRSEKLVNCPVCKNADVAIVPSSVAILGKDSKELDRKNIGDDSPMKTFRLIHEFLEKNFEDIGDKFAEVALKIYNGEEERRNIRGSTTEHEEEMLREEGVPFIKISLPEFDS